MKQKCRNDLIMQGMDVVNGVYGHCLKKYRLYMYLSVDELADLKQDCMVEMIRIIDEKFKPELGFKLSTYLSPRLHGFVKDYIEKITTERCPDVGNTLELLDAKMQMFKSLPTSQIHISAQEIPTGELESLVIEIQSQESEAYEIIDAMLSLPEHRLEVLFGYYFLNKTIRELSEEKGIDPSTGWIYRLRREGIKLLKEALKERGIV